MFSFDVAASDKAAIDKVIADVGPILSRSNSQAAATETATDRKVGYRLTLYNVAAMAPREKVAMSVAVANVETKAAELSALVRSSKGLVSGSNIQYELNGQGTAKLVFDVPLAALDVLLGQFKQAGTVRQQESTRNPQVPENELAAAHIELTLTSDGSIIPPGQGPGAQLRNAVYYCFITFCWVVICIVTGLIIIVPTLLFAKVVWKMINVIWSKPKATPTT